MNNTINLFNNKKCFLFFIIIFLVTSCSKEDVPKSDAINIVDVNHVKINVATAGTLPSLIPSTMKDLITNLTLTGNLNGTDICFIREMAGRDVNGNNTTGKLSILDLSGANIVAGGSYYYCNNNVSEYTSLNKIGDYAFYYCTGLTSVTIPNSVTSIGDYAFEYCTGLTSITIPNSVTSIGFEAFRGCTGSILVTIPNSVVFIGGGAFRGCIGLTSVTIPNSVTFTGNSAFSDCTGLTSVTIPNSVTSIGDNAFWGCTRLTSIIIPNSVTSIGKSAFRDCSKLASITIPSSITFIGDNAFYYCTGIKEIHCKTLTPPTIASNTFGIIDKTTCKLYVPKGTVTSYRSTDWGNFSNIIEE